MTMGPGEFSPVPREARPYQGRPAGVVTRLVAAGIDAVVVLGIQLVGYAALAGLLFLLSPRNFSLPTGSLVLGLGAAFVVLVVYLTVTWSLSGRSYGDLVMGLRVVDHRGRTLPVIGAFARAMTCAVFPVGLLWSAVNPSNKSLQDVVLRTSVIYDWEPRSAGRSRGGGREQPGRGPEQPGEGQDQPSAG